MKSAVSLLVTAMIASVAAAQSAPSPTLPDTQDALKPMVNAGGTELRFDWPMVKIGIGEYGEGPTGVTVFSFDRKVMAAVDVRGGAPGTVNTDIARLGYPTADFDAIVFSGGSSFGLESTTAVSSALKDDGKASGYWAELAVVLGAIVFDFGDRRLNEIYPDKRLAQAAFRAAQPGLFRNGAAGAGRMTRSGDFFGCRAHSGQGGAFRQIGNLKIAAFTVVNAYGAVADRQGHLAACYRDPAWPKDVTVSDLMRGLPDSRKAGWASASGPLRNTTISLVIVNQKMDPSELQRLAIQVHTSMARGIQPFSTMYDGDALYAVSTGEIDPPSGDPAVNSTVIGAEAAEVMWDAILASVPPQDPMPVAGKRWPIPAPSVLQAYSGTYRFSNIASVAVSVEGGKLMAQATGRYKAFNIPLEQKVELLPYDKGRFYVPGRYPTIVEFAPGKITLNPGLWAQVGAR